MGRRSTSRDVGATLVEGTPVKPRARPSSGSQVQCQVDSQPTSQCLTTVGLLRLHIGLGTCSGLGGPRWAMKTPWKTQVILSKNNTFCLLRCRKVKSIFWTHAVPLSCCELCQIRIAFWAL